MRTLLALLTCLALLCSCSSGKHGGDTLTAGDTLTRHAQLLTLIDVGDYRVAEIRDPWDTASMLQTLVIYPRGTVLPPDAPRGVRVETPLRQSVVFSSVHIGAIKELGAVDAVKGVADAPYVKIPEIVEGLAAGSVADIGQSMSPSLEKITMLDPDGILVTPYEGNPGLQYARGRGEVIAMADWMERTPLGRAEWMLLLGELYGAPDKAREIFSGVVRDYNEIATAASKLTDKPKVLTEKSTDGIWYVPGGESYMARMIVDAGGSYPWSDDHSSGSIPLSIERVFANAADADVWLIKTYGYNLSVDNLGAENPVYRRFKAFAEGNMYGADTSDSQLFEEFPFHPERLLSDYYLMFHPDQAGQLQYYRHAN